MEVDTRPTSTASRWRAGVGVHKPIFPGASEQLVLYPVKPRGCQPSAAPLGRRPLDTCSGEASRVSEDCARAFNKLTVQLHKAFSNFQVKAKIIEDKMEATQMPVDSELAEEILAQYSSAVISEMINARDDLRHGKWDIDEKVRDAHDGLCFCLAVVELIHEVAVVSAPSAARLLHWYNRHYLEEDIAEWWQKAQQAAEDPASWGKDSAFWDHLQRLALSDCRTEVLDLLQRGLEASDPSVSLFCAFLRKVPSLLQMDKAKASAAECREATKEINGMASRLLSDIPADHPLRKLLLVYAGTTHEAFEAKEDLSASMSRTWIEDVAYVHAWGFPDLRRTEFHDLLQAVARRRPAEEIDDVDRVLFAALTLDVPGLLQLLSSMQDRFPVYFVTHLVDILYFAGRVPVSIDVDGQVAVPPRDWHLMNYAQELCQSSRAHMRLALDYLRAGGSTAAARSLELTADRYCGMSTTDQEMEESLALLEDLGLAERLSVRQCRRRALQRRSQGDVLGALRWACRAERCAATPRGYYVSELLDDLAGEDLAALLAALTPSSAGEMGGEEVLEKYPPAWLRTALGLKESEVLAPSGRLYFYVQFAQCRALRLAGHPASSFAPRLVEMLSTGAAPPRLARDVIEEELLPLLEDGGGAGGEPALGAEESLLLLRYAMSLANDPLRRCPAMATKPERLLSLLGGCFSRAVLRGPWVQGC